jgi:1,4-dihydroxy-2-naphthoate octaprenyltransferase
MKQSPDNVDMRDVPALPRWRAWLLATRPPTLGASLIPVLVGLALASRSVTLDVGIAAATIVCALLLQIATNLANDYYDFRRGIDTAERLGPLRVTQSGVLTPAAVLSALLIVLVASTSLGAWLVVRGGAPIALIGSSALIVAVGYSAGPWPLASHGLGELLVFAYFGFATVAGTHHLQGAQFHWSVMLAAFPLGALAAAIIVVNNLRDIATDTKAGKRTVAVRIGDRRSRMEYSLLVLSALASTVALAATTTPFVLIALLGTGVAMYEIASVWQRHGAQLNTSLLGTARLHALVGGLVALGLCL